MMTFIASSQHPVTVYYCKAGIQTGQTIRLLHQGAVHNGSGITLSNQLEDGPFAAEMTHDNATGKPKASGARCVLTITRGRVTLTSASAAHPNITLSNGWEMSVERISLSRLESDLQAPYRLTRVNGRKPETFRLLKNNPNPSLCFLISETRATLSLPNLWVRIQPDGTLAPYRL